MNQLIAKTYNPLIVLKSKLQTDEARINEYKKTIIKNLSYSAYITKSGYKKTGYKTFYSRFVDKNIIYRNAYIICKLHINQLGEKNLVSLKNILSVSPTAYALMDVIMTDFQKDLISNQPPILIHADDKFAQVKKDLTQDIDYYIHKDFGTNTYTSLSVQKYEINIIYVKPAENKKIIYKITQDNCNKMFTEKKIETYIKFIQWLNMSADKCYAKVLPIKITVGIKSINDIVGEDVLKTYNITSNDKKSQCMVFNSHFEAIVIYNINKKSSTNVNNYMEEENIDDEYIFSNCVTEELIENYLSTLEQYNIKAIKSVFDIIESNDILLDD